MLPEIVNEEFSAALDAVAAEILAEAAVVGPPVDAVRVATALGITVAWDRGQPGRGRYVRLRGHQRGQSQATILARPEPRREREHWAVAHEIGEHAAHRVFALLGVDPREARPNTREHVANAMACRLLLPTAWFAADGQASGWDLLWLKGRYATASHELIARRMLEMPPPVVVTIFDNAALYFRRSNVGGRVPPPDEAEQACRRIVHDRSQPQEVLASLGRIQGWPIHEPEWKREILRLELNEGGEGW